jgi:uncharacterized damage-inducible protein DinB
MESGKAFLDHSRIFLQSEFLPRILGAVQRMSEEDVWWRPNESSNSVGNLILHLAGNVRQWIVSGVGGAPDVRRRQEEFDQRAPIGTASLLDRLSASVDEAAGVIGSLPPERLSETIQVQGRTVSVMEAIYHVVEHFSMHTGQIIYVAKLRSGEDLGFYRMVDGLPRAGWERPVEEKHR